MFKTGRAAREERERKLRLKHKFENRITVAKYGKECLDHGDYTGAISRFAEYMHIMAEIKEAKDMYGIKPQHFDPRKDLTEMLMISHVYFEMARIYDAVPKFTEECKKCLEQFVAFSANQPYQVVNSEMIRKHLKKSVFKNADLFRGAYEQIFVQSKKCYVVTFCYGHDHPTTAQFRALKDVLLDHPAGREFVRCYYRCSSTLVQRYEHAPLMKLFARIALRPLLQLFSKTFLRFIIK